MPFTPDSPTTRTGSRRRTPRRTVSLILAVLIVTAAAPAAGPADFSDYHTHAELTSALRALTTDNGSHARLESIGETLEGRDIWMLEIANRSGKPVEERPALLVAANFEGNQVVGSELALRTARYLLDSYSNDDSVRTALDEHVFYVIPRVNPDGSERMFAGVQTGSAMNATPYDDDNDARTDEDGPDDLNGDGLITVMRVPDPKGAYMIDPDDERLMRKADPKKGESGAFALHVEGTDDDGDGFYNEDGHGGVDLNRNFQHEYPYFQRGAGLHMVSESESRAVMDFVIAHRNIAAMLVFGQNDNLVNPPNNKGEWAAAKGIDLFSFAESAFDEASTVGMVERGGGGFFRFGGGGDNDDNGHGGGGRRPETTVNTDDLEYFTTVSEKYGELVGIETLPAVREPAGAFFEYGYFQYGVPAFTTPGWGMDTAEADTSSGKDDGSGAGGDDDAPSFDKSLVDWQDASDVDGFVAWTAYDHPELGEVEIGGFKPYDALNPPAEMLDELGPKHGEFVVYLATLFADVRIADTEVIAHGGGVFRVTAEVENAGFLPTSTAHGVVSRSVKPTMVQLGIDPDDLLSGDEKTTFFQATDGSGTRRTFEWIVRGDRGDELELKVVSQKGGSDTATLRLQ